MKQYITVDQLNELSPEAKERLREWWKPQKGDCCVVEHQIEAYTDTKFVPVVYWGTYELDQYEDMECGHDLVGEYQDCLPLLSIGQMIEFLDNEVEINAVVYLRTEPWWHIELTNRSIGHGRNGHIDITNNELCDALWEAVKEMLIYGVS